MADLAAADPTPELSVTALLEAEFDKMESAPAPEAGIDKPEKGDNGSDGGLEGEAEKVQPADSPDNGAPTSELPDENEDTQDGPQEEAAGSTSTVAAPEHWSQADKDRFAKLPDDTRAWWLDKTKDLEKGYQTKFTEASAMRKEADEIGAALKPMDSLLQQHGITRADAVGRLVGADQMLRQNLGDGLRYIVSSYGRQIAGTDQARTILRQVAQELGLEPGAGANGQQPAGEQAEPHPEISALKQTVQEMRREREQEREQQLAQIRQSAQGKLDAFVSAKDATGAPKHPHFEAVKATMGALISAAANSGETLGLDDAYERAVWSRPELREGLTKAQQEAAAKAADEARRSKLASAKAAGTPRTSGAPTRELPPDHSGKGTEQMLRETYDAMAR